MCACLCSFHTNNPLIIIALIDVDQLNQIAAHLMMQLKFIVRRNFCEFLEPGLIRNI